MGVRVEQYWRLLSQATLMVALQLIIHQMSCLLQVTCDGEPLALPDDIEGVLFLNINSYMGGVDLWASGYSSAGSARTGKQSYCDGMLEA